MAVVWLKSGFVLYDASQDRKSCHTESAIPLGVSQTPQSLDLGAIQALLCIVNLPP